MINFLKKLVSWSVSQLVISTVCWGLYELLLYNIDLNLTWFNWIAISIISSLIIPTSKRSEKDDKNKNILDSFKL